MSGGNARKFYVEEGYYHIYNRGVEKREIFLDQQDYEVFLSYLKNYLMPKDSKDLENHLLNPQLSSKQRDKILKLLRLNNFADEITLLAFCLMPNHFHFFIKQKDIGSMDKFMNSFGTRYTKYINTKYKRVGKLYQGNYKAVLITDEQQFIYLSKYIHKQSLATPSNAWVVNQPSSYPEYLGKRKTEWIHPEEVLQYFSKTNLNLSYQSFIEQENNLDLVQNFTIDE